MSPENNKLTLVPCSRQAIQKYIKANNSLGNPTEAMFKSRVNGAIRKGLESGDFSFPKGTFALPSSICFEARHDRI